MIVKDDKTPKGIQRAFFWSMKFPSEKLQVMSMVDDPIASVKVGDYLEINQPAHVLWKIISTNENKTVITALYFSMDDVVLRVDQNAHEFETANLLTRIRVQISEEESEEE